MTESAFSNQLQQLTGMPAAEFVLHRQPMLVLDHLVDIGPEYAICEWHVSEDSAFLVPDRGVPAYAGLEYMAQCVAVYGGARGRINGFPPQTGLLLGTRHYRGRVRYFEVGVAYQIDCRELARTEDGMASFDCKILLDSETIAEGRLTVLEHQKGNLLDG
jgi:predicted hotdog family 3-hydroxylacyl-ACP dehydratase